MSYGPVVVLTAFNLEYEAVRAHLRQVKARTHRAGTRFEVGRLPGSGCEIALALVGKGNHPAAVLAERAMSEFDPPAVLFCGVAGALRPNIALGDVVVATHVYAYHGGTSEDDGLKARPRVWEAPHGPDQIARHLAREGTWFSRIASDEPPQVHFGPIAAGEVVQDSAVSQHAGWIRRNYNDALAIEMEAAGVAQAGHLNRSLPVMVVRGVSDRADGTKTATDGANWQGRAIANAAAFAISLAKELAMEQRDSTAGNTEDRRRGAGMGPSFNNTANDNARVGMQVGVAEGDIYATSHLPGSVDLRGQLAELRTSIDRARERGTVDNATYDAAQTGLVIATEAADAAGPQHRAALTKSLKRLRDLVSDVGELATKVAAVIAAARELS